MRVRKLFFILVLIFCHFTRSVHAESPEFSVLAPLPESILGFAAAYDVKLRRTIVFGGTTYGGEPSNVTYVNNGNGWTTLTSTETPPPRTGHVMTGMSGGDILLFGGISPKGEYLNDTWILHGESWTKISAGASPIARTLPSFVFDESRNAVFLFGGFHPRSGDLNDTWAFDGKKWRLINTTAAPPPRSMAAFAYDADKKISILAGGFGPRLPGSTELIDLDDAWTWNGSVWSKIENANTFGPRSNARAAYGGKIKSVFIYGGFGNGRSLTDLWTFRNGRFEPAADPPFKLSYADIAFVEQKETGKILVVTIPDALAGSDVGKEAHAFGGDPQFYCNDTWIFRGKEWQRLPTEISPPPRTYAPMAFDPLRKKIVLFGGSDTKGTPLSDTWEFDGSTWRQVRTIGSPPARFDHRMVFDERLGRIVLFGGYAPSAGDGLFGDTWTYDGTTWTKLPTKNAPPPRSRHVMAFDARLGGTIIAFGYTPSHAEFGDVWLLKNNDWTELSPSGDAPLPRASSSAAYVSALEGTLFFGGASREKDGPLSDTWLLRNNAWEEYRLSRMPPPRFDASLAATTDGKAAFLFGGFNNQRDLGDAWAFDGKNWDRVDSKENPSPRSYFSMAAAQAFGGIVLFGGFGAAGMPGTALKDDVTRKAGTWEFDGKKWKSVPVKNAPTAQISYSFCFDEKNEVGVLFGGYSDMLGELNETWIFNGTDWTLVKTPVTPSARTSPNLVYDPKRKAVLLFGGYSQTSGALNDMWEFDGKTWKKFTIDAPYSNYTGGTNMIYNPAKKIFWLYGARPKP